MAKYFSAESLCLQNEDSSSSKSELELDDTAQEQVRITYTQDFLLHLAELDTCRELPFGFDSSILSEFDDSSSDSFQRRSSDFDDASDGSFHRRVTYTTYFLLAFAELDVCKELPCDLDSLKVREFDDANNGIFQRQKKSAFHNDHNGVVRRQRKTANPPLLQSWSNIVSDNTRRYSHSNKHELRLSDGILGNGAFKTVPAPSSGSSALLDCGFGNCLLKRSDAPYRPPHSYKALPPSGRENNNSSNSATFVAPECSNEERQESWKKASFELMRKYEQKETEGKMAEEFDPHDPSPVKDFRMKFVKENNEPKETGSLIVANDEITQETYSIQTAASRQLFPHEFMSSDSATREILTSSGKENIEYSKNNSPLTDILGTCAGPDFHIQSRSVGMITSNHDLKLDTNPSLIEEKVWFPSTADKCRFVGTIGDRIPSKLQKCRSIGIIGEHLHSTTRKCMSTGTIGEGILASKHSDHGLSYNSAWANIGFHPQIDQDSINHTRVKCFKNKVDPFDEICLPEEDSLITIDDFLIPLHPMNDMPARSSIQNNYFQPHTNYGTQFCLPLDSCNPLLPHHLHQNGFLRSACHSLSEHKQFPGNFSHQVSGSFGGPPVHQYGNQMPSFPLNYQRHTGPLNCNN